MKKLIEKRTIRYRHINVCTGKTIDLLSLAQIIKDISKTKRNIVIARKGLKKEYSGDNAKLLKIIGSYKFTPVQKAIFELYSWYSNNLKLIDRAYLVKND
jgi:GDP-L-fucose synthase